MLDLFDRLGVNPSKEAERHHFDRHHFNREEPGRHFYGGWLHFIGRINAGRDVRASAGDSTSRLKLASVTDDLAIGFTEQARRVRKPFGAESLVQIEFTGCLPRVLDGVEEPE